VERKFNVKCDSPEGTIIPTPTAAEERRYAVLLDDAEQIRNYVADALEDKIRNADDERLRKNFPPGRVAKIANLLSRTDSLLYELESQLDEIVESDNDAYERAALLNELDAIPKKRKRRKSKRLCSGASRNCSK